MNTNSKPDLLTLLPKQVINIHDAEAVLLALAMCDKMYHFDDDPREIACFTPEEAEAVDTLMEQADDVTRLHFGMVDNRWVNAGIWEGIVKDVLPGYMAFGADNDRATIYVYNDFKLSQVYQDEWEKIKVDTFDEESGAYDTDGLDPWFEGLERVN